MEKKSSWSELLSKLLAGLSSKINALILLIALIAAVAGLIKSIRTESRLYALIFGTFIVIALILFLVHVANAKYRSPFDNRERYRFERKRPIAFIGIGFILGFVSSFLVSSEGRTFIVIALHGTSTPTTTAANNTPLPTTNWVPTPTFGPIPTPAFDIHVVNEHTTWDPPPETMYINAPKPITITVDPGGTHQANCSNWNIQPQPKLEPEEDGCKMTFYADSFYDTTVTVKVSINGIIVSKTLAFHPK